MLSVPFIDEGEGGSEKGIKSQLGKDQTPNVDLNVLRRTSFNDDEHYVADNLYYELAMGKR
jgi:hypothetical protein